MFLDLCGRQKLPMPEVNAWIGRDRVDFLWRESRLIVETDGYRYHRGRVAFEDDHARDNRLRELGFEVLRFTYWRVIDEPGAVAALVRHRSHSPLDGLLSDSERNSSRALRPWPTRRRRPRRCGLGGPR